ncbi:hypothetical protein [Burkholderia ubonensis]|uniref:hypothetical protein n=1 Tax=Burkholderia ubonensis TaxID=101571 RepID=UPI00116064E9|nr:hypothetical protein [Burkholderia ubonensis]
MTTLICKYPSCIHDAVLLRIKEVVREGAKNQTPELKRVLHPNGQMIMTVEGLDDEDALLVGLSLNFHDIKVEYQRN